MKKLVIRLLVALVIVIIVAVLAIGLFLDRAIKAGVETVGPMVTGVDVKLHSLRLSLLSGSGDLHGLVVGNPSGFKTPWAINVGTASFALEPRSLLSGKIIIKSISVQEPQITFETDLRANNLSRILANVQAVARSGEKAPTKPSEAAQPKEARAGKKLEVDDFLIKGGKIHVIVTNASVIALGGQSAMKALPDIHLQDLGKGPDGITAAELTQRVLEAILPAAVQAAADVVADIKKGALYMSKDLGKGDTNAVEKVTKGLGDLFKKK
jgi:uncharacterized protein involved in outer membrane biogenesis